MTRRAFLKLMRLGEPSKFGDLKAQENRLDPQVRVATEFSEFSWKKKGTGWGWGQEVLKGLFDRDWRQYCLAPYKLNIYGPGGFFKAHRPS